MTHDTREALAAYAHEAWSGWIHYMLGKGSRRHDGAVTLPPAYVQALERLARTPYAELDEAQKDNDRAEADKMLLIVVAHEPPDLATLEPTRCAHCGQPIALIDGLWAHYSPPQPFHWPEPAPPPDPVPATVRLIGEHGEMRRALKELRTAWDALCDCIDEFDPNDGEACGERRDALDTAILAALKVLDDTRGGG